MKPSKVLAKLRSGKPAFCTKTNLIDPRVIDIIGHAGFDCVWLCNEHVPNDWFVLENQVRAAKMHGLDTVVRVCKGSYSDYIKPLEADATGVMVPHVFSAEEARYVVKTTKFMPLGRRPIDGGNADGHYCMLPVKEYFEIANRERFTIIQIEDPEPLEELEEICSVDGIDVVFFGPGDFTHAIGHVGEINHPKVVETKRRIVEGCRKNGKWAGIPTTVDTVQQTIDEGFQFLAIAADVAGLGLYFRDIWQNLIDKKVV